MHVKMNRTEDQKLLEEAIIDFERTANTLINLLSKTYDLNLCDTRPFEKLITRQNNLWKGNLEGNWKYQFHGDACKFENIETKQIVDVKINRNGNWGTLSNFYLYKYIETTDSLKHVYRKINTEHKVIDLLEELLNLGVLIDIGEPPFSTRILKNTHANKV